MNDELAFDGSDLTTTSDGSASRRRRWLPQLRRRFRVRAALDSITDTRVTSEIGTTRTGINPSQDAAALLADTWDNSLPIDPVKIARKLGVEVVEAYLGSATSGALIKERQRVPTIVLNQTDSPNRKRFTCAHELGHYMRRTDGADDQGGEYEYVDRRDPLASTGTDAVEIYANRFAASLLMPVEHVRRLAVEGMRDVQMAIRFDVSLEAMQYRLRDLGLG
jgi:Zn-dependent peptidase ImmA (M78 family)